MVAVKNLTRSCTLTNIATLVFVYVAWLHFTQKRSPQYVQVSLALSTAACAAVLNDVAAYPPPPVFAAQARLNKAAAADQPAC